MGSRTAMTFGGTGAALLATLLTASPAAADPTPPARSEMHNVVCSTAVRTPIAIGTSVNASGTWRCNASPDIALTTIVVQIRENGSWRDYGNASTSASTAPNGNMSDGAPAKAGCWDYRGRITREGFHHTWGITTKYSPGTFRMCR